MLLLSYYATLIFDCDGVILNSNKVKTDAFYKAALPYGIPAAQELVSYHISNGGVSRYKKFSYFVDKIVPARAPGIDGPNLEALLQCYAQEVRQGLLICDIAEGLEQLRDKTRHARWLIVSGGDQTELRNIFTQRGLDELFDGGVFGSPETKEKIILREFERGNLKKPGLFLGDSKYDYQTASAANLDFLFISEWSEVPRYEVWLKTNGIASVRALRALLDV